MKKFIKKIALFCTVLLLINGLIYYQFMKPKIYEPYYKNQSVIGKETALLLADSHGAGLNKKNLSEHGIYNFAFGGDNYIDMFYKLLYFHKQQPGLDTLILSVDDHMLSKYREVKNNNTRSLYYATEESHAMLHETGSLGYYFGQLKSKLSILEPKNAAIIKLAISSKIRSGMGTVPKPIPWLEDPRKEELSLTKKKEQFPGSDASEELTKALRKIMDYCQEHQITIVGLKYPLDGTYLKVLEEVGYDADMIVEKEGNTVIDLKELYRDKPEYFENQDHLNKVGSHQFMEVLLTELNRTEADNP